jgi:hypothetical protein
MMDARMGSRIAILHANPVADAWQIGLRFARIDELARQFGGQLIVLVPDDVLVAINCCHSGD